MDFFSEIELARKGLWKGCFFLDNKNKLDKFGLFGLKDTKGILYLTLYT